MNRIVIVHSNFLYSTYTGNFFYLEEIASYLKHTTEYDIKILSNNFNRKKLCERYIDITSETHEIQQNDVIICAFKSINDILPYIDIVSKIYITESAYTYEYFNSDIKNIHMLKIIRNIKKFCLLSQKEFTKFSDKHNNTLIKRVLYITRGFYFDNYIPALPSIDESYIYHYNPEFDTEYDSKNIDDMLDYAKQNKLHVKNSRTIDSVNPANHYSGLMYIRKSDYMPRLPYEFWHYNKPVIFFDLSDGIKKIYSNIQLHRPIIKTNLFNINLDELVLDIERGI